MKCRSLHAKRVTKMCRVCRKPFAVLASIQNRYSVCSFACRKKRREYRTLTCKRCRKLFISPEHRWTPSFCSEKCRRPPVMIVCKTCLKSFRRTPSESMKAQFCSIACYRRFKGETSIESLVREGLASLGVSFIQELKLGRYSVDFGLLKDRVALEVDGAYWHRDRKRDARKEAFLTLLGWRIIRIGEFEIKSVESIQGLILRKLEVLVKP